jgi:xanthine dehydrogenase/oxidase
LTKKKLKRNLVKTKIKISKIKKKMSKSFDKFEFYLNNKKYCEPNVDPKETLLKYLRRNGFYGTKYGCGEGGCGACTIVLAEYNSDRQMIHYRTANSCLLPLCACYGKQVITVEGIGDPVSPHPIQERFAKGHASQCGFCTPGFVMSLYGLLKLKPNPTMHDIEDAFDGNLCRCTGYRPILEISRTFSPNNETNSNNNSTNVCKTVEFSEFKPYDPNADVKFPEELLNFQR